MVDIKGSLMHYLSFRIKQSRYNPDSSYSLIIKDRITKAELWILAILTETDQVNAPLACSWVHLERLHKVASWYWQASNLGQIFFWMDCNYFIQL